MDEIIETSLKEHLKRKIESMSQGDFVYIHFRYQNSKPLFASYHGKKGDNLQLNIEVLFQRIKNDGLDLYVPMIHRENSVEFPIRSLIEGIAKLYTDFEIEVGMMEYGNANGSLVRDIVNQRKHSSGRV